MPRSMISRRSARSWRTMTTANSSSGNTAAATSTMRCERSLTSTHFPSIPLTANIGHAVPLSVGGAHERLETNPYLVARGNDETRGALQEIERLRWWAARQSAAGVPAQALCGDRLPAARGPGEQRGHLARGRGRL